MNLPVIPADKANHFCYGAVIACCGMYWTPMVALCLAAAVGAAKEVYDRVSKRGTPDGMDAVWTVAGATPVVLPAALRAWL